MYQTTLMQTIQIISVAEATSLSLPSGEPFVGMLTQQTRLGGGM